MGLFRKGKTCIIAKPFGTDLVICSHYRDGDSWGYPILGQFKSVRSIIIVSDHNVHGYKIGYMLSFAILDPDQRLILCTFQYLFNTCI